MIKTSAFLFASFILSSCCFPKKNISNIALPRPVQYSNDSLPKIYKIEAKALRRLERPKLGLALSGGGVRSAYFSIGVMKALYDAGLLQKVDAISSVSGGGYASYWLYTRETQYGSGSKDFGHAAFSSENYKKWTDKLVRRGNMFSGLRMAWTLPTAVHRPTLIGIYEKRVNFSFGIPDTESFITFRDVKSYLKETPNAPFPIFNATICAKVNRSVKNFEFTATHTGNPEIEPEPWSRTGSRRVSLAAAISGAAFKPIMGYPYKYVSKNNESKTLTLGDGGWNENSGALALIRRGTKTVILVDAEHSANYKFGLYHSLKLMLNEVGLDIKIQDIENFSQKEYSDRGPFLPHAVYTGKIYPRGSSSGHPSVQTIHYVRMAHSESLREQMKEQEIKSVRRSSWVKDIHSDVSYVDGSRNSKILVASYSDDINRRKGLRIIRSKGKMNALSYSFPEATTMDQNYSYPDQVAAFIALGAIQGKNLIQEIKKH